MLQTKQDSSLEKGTTPFYEESFFNEEAPVFCLKHRGTTPRRLSPRRDRSSRAAFRTREARSWSKRMSAGARRRASEHGEDGLWVDQKGWGGLEHFV